MSEHSPIGASSMKRWQACPGSVRMSEGIESVSSFYAAEGTVAHWVGEQCLTNNRSPQEYVGQVVEQDGFDIEITDEMVEAVQVYLDTVNQNMMPGDKLLVEHRFHLVQLNERLWGTSDATILSPGMKWLTVIDYKHGQGVAVEVKDNPQLLYYAAGALLETKFGAKKVEMVIVQPRCPHPEGSVRCWEVDALDLLDWVPELVDAAKATEDPNAPLATGDHCRWCPAAAICPQLRQEVYAIVQDKFDGSNYDPEQLATDLENADNVEAWAKAVRSFAYNEAQRGRVVPRFKLVAKKANRSWKDEREAKKFLVVYGLDDADMLTEPKLKSPAQIEKVIGRANKDAITPLVTQESNGTVLVPETDKRPAVAVGPEADFSAVAD